MSVRFIGALGFIAVFTIAASAKTSVYTIPGEASAVVTNAPDIVTFQLTDLFSNPMDLLDDLSAFFATFGMAPESAQSASVRRPVLQIRVEGLLRADTGSHQGAYCRFFPPRAVDDMSGGLHAPPMPPLFEARSESVIVKPSPFRGDAHVALLDRTATWTVAEMGGASLHRVGSIRFEFGTTDGRDQVAGALPVRREPSVPGMLAAFVFIVLAGFIILWKRQPPPAAVAIREGFGTINPC